MEDDFGLGIADFGLTVGNPQSEIRNPKLVASAVA
jgi:hypothetical protein